MDLGDRGKVVFVTAVGMRICIAATQTVTDEVAHAMAAARSTPSLKDLPGVSGVHADLADSSSDRSL